MGHRIGVFDSGLGGLTVLGALQRAMPWVGFTYLGDHARAPYGERSAADIHNFTRNAVRYLFDNECDLVILACNTASAVALHDLQTDWLPAHDEGRDRRVLGVLVPMIEAMTQRHWGDNTPPTHTGLENVLLFATEATVESGAFPRELKFRARDVNVVPQACPDLVPAIESGDPARIDAVVHDYVRQGLAKLPAPQCAALACTHYPLALRSFSKALGKGPILFSQPDIVAASLSVYLERHPRFKNATGSTRYLTTGDKEAADHAALQLLDVATAFEAVEIYQG